MRRTRRAVLMANCDAAASAVSTVAVTVACRIGQRNGGLMRQHLSFSRRCVALRVVRSRVVAGVGVDVCRHAAVDGGDIERVRGARTSVVDAGQDPRDGWAIGDGSDSVSVHVYVGRYLRRSTVTNVSRPDVAQAFPGHGDKSGFSAEIASSAGYTVCAYALTDDGRNPLLGCRTIDVPINPFGTVDALSLSPGGLIVRGWAIDPDAPSTPVDVHVYVDGILRRRSSEGSAPRRGDRIPVRRPARLLDPGSGRRGQPSCVRLRPQRHRLGRHQLTARLPHDLAHRRPSQLRDLPSAHDRGSQPALQRRRISSRPRHQRPRRGPPHSFPWGVAPTLAAIGQANRAHRGSPDAEPPTRSLACGHWWPPFGTGHAFASSANWHPASP